MKEYITKEQLNIIFEFCYMNSEFMTYNSTNNTVCSEGLILNGNFVSFWISKNRCMLSSWPSSQAQTSDLDVNFFYEIGFFNGFIVKNFFKKFSEYKKFKQDQNLNAEFKKFVTTLLYKDIVE